MTKCGRLWHWLRFWRKPAGYNMLSSKGEVVALMPMRDGLLDVTMRNGAKFKIYGCKGVPLMVKAERIEGFEDVYVGWA